MTLKRLLVPFAIGMVSFLALPSVSADCRPKTCFYWISDCMTREGLSADIAALSAAGISEAYICAANMMTRPASIGAQLLSPEWMSLFEHAVKEAKAHGLKFGFHNCPGWSESGGPWIQPEDSMKYVVFETKDVKPGEGMGEWPQPRINHGFYRDLTTVAFPYEPSPEVMEASRGEGDDALPFFRGKQPLVLPLAKGPNSPLAVTARFARPFVPTAMVLRFLDSNVNCEGTVEGSSDGRTWTRVGKFNFHFHFVPTKTGKIVCLETKQPMDRFRIVFRANAVPEWQGGKYVDRRLDSVEFSTAAMIADADLKTSASTQFSYVPPRDPSVTGVSRQDFLTLSERDERPLPARADGKVWRVLRLGYTTTGKSCAPATLRGLECDKLSRRGLDAHWPNMPGRLLAVPGAREVLTSFYIDSWEAGGQNWTEDFEKEFFSRRGYALRPYLPVFAGLVVDDAATTAKVMFDIQQTVADLVAENYFGYYAELCRRAGVKASTEAYGGAFDSLRCAGLADLPTGELWIGGKYEASLKMASSAAHVHGIPMVESETFTTEFAEGRWQITPHELKVWGDIAWVNGVNSIIYHSYAHQPLEAKPGISLGRHGTQLNRHTTWWPEMRHWSEYVRRGQELLQSGKVQSDLLIVADEGAPNAWVGLPTTNRAGYHFDSTSAFDFRRMACFADGVGLEGGSHYPVVFLPGRHYTLATLRKVAELAAAGAKIAGVRPIDTPTLSDDVKAWSDLRDDLWKRVVMQETDAGRALERFGVHPSVVSSPMLSSIRCKKENGETVFFVVNRSKTPFCGPVSFAAAGAGEIRDCVDGSTAPYAGTLELPPNGSAFVVFGGKACCTSCAGRAVLRKPERVVDISRDWTIVSFEGNVPPDAPRSIERLFDWSASTDERLKYFAGRAVYEKRIKRPWSGSLALDLGEVRDIANVFVDGCFVACLWEPPYRVELPKTDSKEMLTLRVEVVNTWPNRLIGDAVLRGGEPKERKGAAGWPTWVLEQRTESGFGISTWSNFGWAWTAEDQLRPAGLIGPVRLY